MRFTSVDLPTLGRPTTATTGIASATPSSSASWSVTAGCRAREQLEVRGQIAGADPTLLQHGTRPAGVGEVGDQATANLLRQLGQRLTGASVVRRFDHERLAEDDVDRSAPRCGAGRPHLGGAEAGDRDDRAFTAEREV